MDSDVLKCCLGKGQPTISYSALCGNKATCRYIGLQVEIPPCRSLFLSWYFWTAFTPVGVVDSYPGESEHLWGVGSKPYCDDVTQPSDTVCGVGMEVSIRKWNSKPVFTWSWYWWFKDSGPLAQQEGLFPLRAAPVERVSVGRVSLVIYCPFLFFYVLYLSFLQWQFHL